MFSLCTAVFALCANVLVCTTSWFSCCHINWILWEEIRGNLIFIAISSPSQVECDHEHEKLLIKLIRRAK